MGKMKSFLDEFMIEVKWQDIAMVKICMVSFGVLLGASIPKKTRKFARGLGGLMFLASAVLIFLKILGVDYPMCKNFLSAHGIGESELDYDHGFDTEFEYDFEDDSDHDDMEYDFED
ncbi:MAG: hypothetical protein R3Y53_03730 [Bacillota bacterium]